MQGIEQLVKKGLSLIPLQKNSKRPIIKWKQFQYRRAGIEEVFDWYMRFGNDINIGIVTGRISRDAVVDVDDLNKLPELTKLVPGLWETCRVRTPRPGLQFHFSTDGDKIRSRQNFLGIKNVELKAEGRYVVCTNSIVNGVRYKFERTFSHILPAPKIITGDQVNKVRGIYLPPYRGRALCISQISNKDIAVGQRKTALFILYSKMLECGNTKEYAINYILKKNNLMSNPLADKDITAFGDGEVIYHYSCSSINTELEFVSCRNCRVRGGLKKVEKLSDKDYQGVLGLTSSERSIAFLLDSYWLGDNPSINEIQKKTGMNFYVIRDALKRLKEKEII